MEKPIKKVYIERKLIEIDCDLGTQDIAWLAMSAAYSYGLSNYPVSRYVPCLAKNKAGEILHPKLCIMKYDKLIGEEVYVKIKPDSQDVNSDPISQEEINWLDQAFGNERFYMNINLKFVPTQEFKFKDYVFTAVCKYSINRPLLIFFPKYENIDNVNLELKEVNGVYQTTSKIPFGILDISKIQYTDKDGNVKETFDFSKNKLTIEKFPDPLLPGEKENAIKKKEEILKLKQVTLTTNIKEIEEMKKTENQRLNELEQFLSSIPFTLDDIFEYTTKEIQDCEKDMIPVFANMEKDEYAIFRKLYEIFSDYQKFYDDENSNNTLDVEGMINFFKNYFDYSKDELGSLLMDYQKLYISRIEDTMEYNFLEFVYTILYLLYNIQIYKNIIIEAELKNVCKIHDGKLKEKAFHSMYKDDGVTLILNLNVNFLKQLFMRFSSKKFENYYEMSINQFMSLAKEVSQKKGHDYFKMTQEQKFLDGLNFFDFLERIAHIGIVIFENNDFDYQTKVESFITDLKAIYSEQLE